MAEAGPRSPVIRAVAGSRRLPHASAGHDRGQLRNQVLDQRRARRGTPQRPRRRRRPSAPALELDHALEDLGRFERAYRALEGVRLLVDALRRRPQSSAAPSTPSSSGRGRDEDPRNLAEQEFVPVQRVSVPGMSRSRCR